MRLSRIAVILTLVAGCRDLSVPEQLPRSTLTGHLVLEDGTPATGVEVQLLRDGMDLTSAATDAMGAFSFPGLAPGAIELRVAPPDFVEVVRTLNLVAGATRDLPPITLYAIQRGREGDGQIDGKVVVTGGGDVTGAEVEFLIESTQQRVAVAVVGNSGEFSQRLAPNTYTLKATHPFFVSPPARMGIILAAKELKDLKPQPLVFQINPARVRGKVTKERDLAPAPVEAVGAQVTADTGASATTDQAGNFDLGGLPAGRRTLTVTLPGFHDPIAVRSLDLLPAETRMLGDVDLLLDRGDITGEVSMKDNTPLRDVTASLDIATTDGGALDGGSFNPYSAAVAPSATEPSKGAFVIKGVPVGTWSVKASRENYITSTSGAVQVQLNRAAAAGLLELVRIQGDFVIDDGDGTNTPGFTRTPNVTLRLNGAGNASEYKVAENDPSLATVPFVVFGAQPDGGVTSPNSIPLGLSSGDGSKTIFLQYKDGLGNVSGILSASVVLDTVAPGNLSLVLEDGADFTRSSLALLASVVAIDPRGTGVDNVSGVGHVKLAAVNTLDANGQLIAGRQAYAPNLTFSRGTTQDGPQVVYAQFIDNAGNASLLTSDSVVIDTVPPSGSMTITRGARATLAGVTNSPLVDLQLTAAAEPNGGYVQVKFSNENAADLSGAVLQRVRSSMAWFIEPTEGGRTVHYALVDAAGNAAGQSSQPIRYDITAPNGTITLTSGSPTNSLATTLNVVAVDPGGNPLSPTQALTLSEDPSFSSTTTIGPMALSMPAQTFTFLTGDGPRVIYARFRDAAGNDSTATVPVVVDQSPPIGSISLEGTLADGTMSPSITAAAAVTVRIQQAGATLIALGNETLVTCPAGAGAYAALTATSITNHVLSGAATPREVRACLRDAAGNLAGPLIATIALDSAAPTGCTLGLGGRKIDGSVAPAGRTALRDLTATVTGCVETPAEVFLTENAVVCSASAALAWVPFSTTPGYALVGADGLTQVRGCVRDAARNTATLAAVPMTLDTTPPTVSPTIVIDNGATYVNLAQATTRGGTIAPVVGTAAGATEWALSETNPPPTFSAFTGSNPAFLFADAGVRTVYAQFRDDVGNTTPVAQDSIEFDLQPPTGAGGVGLPSITVVGTLADGTTSLTSSATTSVSVNLTVEGASEYYVGNESLVACPASGYLPLTAGATSLQGQTLTGAASPREVRICFRDAAANTVGPISDTITLDVAPPTGCALTVNGFKRDTTAAPADRTALFDVSVGVAGCVETPTEIYLSEGTPVCSSTVSLPWTSYASAVPLLLSGGDGLHTVRGCVRDAARNVTNVTADTITVDTEPPTSATVSINGNAGYINASQVIAGSTTLVVTGAATGAIDWAIAESSPPAGFLALASNNPRNFPITVSSDSTRTIYAIFRDDLQNAITTPVEDSIIVDRTFPTGPGGLGVPSIAVVGVLADGLTSSTATASTQVTVQATVGGAVEYLLAETLPSCPASGYTPLLSSALPFTLGAAAGSHTVRACFRDAAGNASGPLLSNALTLDSSIPTGCALTVDGFKRDFSVGPANRTATTDVRVQINGCGETPTEVYLTESPISCVATATFPWLPFGSLVSMVLSSGDGTHTVRGCVRDASHNVTSVTADDTVLDTAGPSAPSVAINAGADYVNQSQVIAGSTTLTMSGSAVGAVDWAADESTSPANFIALSGTRPLTITVSSDSVRTISAVFRDDLLNPSATVSDDISIDTSPPGTSTMTMRVLGNAPVAGFTNSESVTVAVAGSNDAVDAFLAEHAGIGGCLSGDFVSAPRQSVLSAYGFVLTSPESTKRVCLRYRDAAGNVSSVLEDTIVLDKTPPTAPLITNLDQYTRDVDFSPFVVNIVAPSIDPNFRTYERLGGRDEATVPLTSWTATAPVVGQPTRFLFREINDGGETGVRNEFRLRATDNAGNVSGESLVVVTADTNAPDPVTWLPEWVDNGDSKATIYWLDPSTGAVPDLDHYNVYYGSAPTFADSEAAGFANEGVSPVRVPARSNTTLSGLSNGTTAYVRVRGVDLAGNKGEWLPDAGTTPLRLQPGEVSPNELSVLNLPAGADKVHRLARQGNIIYALATSTPCSGTVSSTLTVLAIDMLELASPVQKGSAHASWAQPVVASSQTFADAVNCIPNGSNGDLIVSGHWLFVLGPRYLRIFELKEPGVLTAPLYVIDVTTVELNSRALSMSLLGDRLVVTGRRAIAGYFAAVLNLADLYDNAVGTTVTTADLLPPLLFTVGGATNYAAAGTVTRDRLIIPSRDIVGGSSPLTYVANLTPSLTGVLAPVHVGIDPFVGAMPLSRPPTNGNLAYYTSPTFGLTTYDVTALWGGSAFETPAVATAYLGGGQFDVSGHQIFVPEDTTGLRVFDFSQPTFPRDVGLYSLGNVSHTLTFGNYAVASAPGQLHFYELATPRGLRTFTAQPGAGYNPKVEGGFLYTGMGFLYDLQAGLGLVKPPGLAPSTSACTLGASYDEEAEVSQRGNGIRVTNLEPGTDRSNLTNFYASTDTNVATGRVTDVELFGNHLIVAEVRPTGVYLEVFRAGKVRNRSGAALVNTALPAGDSVGSVLVVANGGPASMVANISVAFGRVAVGLEANDGTNPSTGPGNNLYFVELNDLLDDNAATNLTTVHGPVSVRSSAPFGIDPVNEVVMQGRYAYAATLNGIYVIDIAAVMDNSSLTSLPVSPAQVVQANIFTGNAFDGVFVDGSMLLATPGEKVGVQLYQEGLYSIDVSSPLTPEVQAFLPINGTLTSCTPLNDSPRRMRARVAVAGSRAYLTGTGTVRVIDLE